MDIDITSDAAGIAYVHLDDGGRNVFTRQAAARLDETLAALEASAETNTVILSGREAALSVGLDTETVLRGDDDARALIATMGRVLARLYLGPLRSVVITQGHATAAGAMLLMVADHRIGVEGPGKIGLSEVKYGLDVPLPTQQLVRDRIATRFQYAATAGATLFETAAAQDAGFIDAVAANRDEAMTLALAAATALSALPDSGYLATKRAMRTAFRALMEDGV